jgi:hypothetical protein
MQVSRSTAALWVTVFVASFTLGLWLKLGAPASDYQRLGTLEANLESLRADLDGCQAEIHQLQGQTHQLGAAVDLHLGFAAAAALPEGVTE